MDIFYTALVEPDELVFGVEHQREDLVLESFFGEHLENQIPKLTLVVRNPGVGILAPGRKRWMWLARRKGVDVKPIFFGEVVGVPTSVFGETLTIELTAEPLDYDEQIQNLAETLKVPPNYNMIFTSVTDRDDPSHVLEGYSADWHIPRVPGLVTVTDVLEGEDGEEVFQVGIDPLAEVPYDSVDARLAQNPQASIMMDATVTWTQEATGIVDLGRRVFKSYTGDGIIGDWPKPLASLGGGYTVASSSAVDLDRVSEAGTLTIPIEWHNGEKEHINGDTLSVTGSIVTPQVKSALVGVISFKNQIGFFDPYNDPQTNIPAHVEQSTVHVPAGRVETTLAASYEAKRPRTERLRFTLNSDLQDVLTKKGSKQIVKKTGVDVGQPLLNVLNWLSVKGEQVEFGTLIKTSEGTFQIALVPGLAGDGDEPAFSNLVGVETIDNEVTWAGLGESMFSPNTPEWLPGAYVPLGEVIFPKPPKWSNWTVLHSTDAEVDVPEGTIIKRSNGASYQQATIGGNTGTTEPLFSDTRGVTTVDNEVTWTSLGPDLPGGAAYFVCVTEGTTGPLQPTFATTAGSTTTDGSVVWKSLSLSGAFIGIPIRDVSRRSFFTTDEGRVAIEYLLCCAAAFLRIGSRVVEITFTIPFERALDLSCRKNARLYDRRLFGGQARGKIIGYTFESSGATGVQIGTVTIGCSIGNGGFITEVLGTPAIWEEGVYEKGVQYYEGATRVLNAGAIADVGYTPPVDVVSDDGIVFPIAKADQVVTLDAVHGTLEAQQAAILTAFRSEVALANLPQAGSDAQQMANNQKTVADLNSTNIAAALKANPVYAEIHLRPLDNGPFNYQYDLIVTNYRPPQTINLGGVPI